MNAIKVGQSWQSYSGNRDLGCVRLVRYSCLFGNKTVRPTGLSADDRCEYRLTVQTRVEDETGVCYPPLDISGVTHCVTCVYFREFVYL